MQSDLEPASDNPIVILPTSAAYADQMETLTGIVYDVNPREAEGCLTAEHFRRHVEVFPEGQFIAVDRRSQQVVGLTASMRFDYNPARPILEPWWYTIGYG